LLAYSHLPWLKINRTVAFRAHRIGPDQDGVSQGSLQGEEMLITHGIDRARSPVGTLDGAVERHDEVAAHPATALERRKTVHLDEIGIIDCSRCRTVRAEDQLHRTIVACQAANAVQAKASIRHNRPMPNISALLRLPPGPVDLAALDPRATPGFPGDKHDAPAMTKALAPALSDLQERLFAAGRADESTSTKILVVLQGMDTSGKGGVIRHAIGMVDPQGVKIKAFKAPTEEERAHPYLWRIERELPQAGLIGIFDRSHYEDVLVVRVHNLVEESVWSTRYDEINAWEENLVARGTVLIKCFLDVSSAEQKSRLLARLDDPTKHWKYNPGDVDERALWPAYLEAYQAVLERCNTERAPWYVVPADRKWYRNWAVAQLLVEHLRALDLRWPVADFDVEKEKARVAAS
jgi:PPK2 family polyphosphate:nucleotide phosphotransferase